MLKLALCLARHSFISLLLVVCTLSIPTPHGLNPPSPPTTTTTTTTDVLLIPPTITSEPQRLHYCEKEPTERIVLKCTATGNPQPIISWHRLGGSLPNESEDNGLGTLTLKANNSDGYYQCRAENIAGNITGIALSNITRLLCLIDVHKKIEQQPATVVVVHTATVVLQCCPEVELYPVLSLIVKWFMKNNCNTDNSPKTPIPSSQKYHLADEYNNTLVITDLQQNDIQCFTYSCELEFYTERNKGFERYQEFSLSGSPGGASNERRLVYRSQPITAVDGDDVTMTCVYSGRTPADVTWSRRSGRPVRGHVTVFGRQLRLQNVREEDSDDYSCTATDSRDTNNTIQLTVDVKPLIVVPLPSVNVTVGANISFSCKYSGRPRPEATWYINGEPFRGGQLPFSRSTPIHINSYEIHITFIELDSGFVVSCNVSNIHDYEMSTAYVAVQPLNYHVTTTSTAGVSGTESSTTSPTDVVPFSLSVALLSVPVAVVVVVVVVLIVLVVVVVVAVFCAKRRRRQPRTEDKKPEKREVAPAPAPPQLDNQSMNSNSRQSLSSSSSISASLASFDSGIDEVANSEDNKINEQLHLMNEQHPRAEDADTDTDDAS